MLRDDQMIVRMPAGARAVAVLTASGSPDDARLADALAAGRIGVICVPPKGDLDRGMRLADEHFDRALPRLVAASGWTIPGAQAWASREGLDGAVLLNVPVGRPVRGRTMPTVVYADHRVLASKLWGRVASGLGRAAFHTVDGDFHATVPTGAPRLTPPLPGRVAALVAAAAVAAAPAVIVADPFDGGVEVDAARVSGDAAGSKAGDKQVADDGDEVPVTAIAGDGRRLVAPAATGSLQFVDASNFKWFVNTNITFQTTSSASAAMSEAVFTQSGPATTLNGATVITRLNDAFDGYQTLFVGAAGTLVGIDTISYNRTGAPATLDVDCASRQAVFPVKVIEGLEVTRRVYVPADDSFARWVSTFTNSTGAPITVGVGAANNLGSDANTRIVTTSSGDATATADDLWVTTFQNYSGTNSSDPRLGHVLQGAGAPVPLSGISFSDGDDNPHWSWDLTVRPGESVSIVNFAVGQPSKDAAAAAAAKLAALTPEANGVTNALRCLDEATLGTMANFDVPDVTVAGVTVREHDGVATVRFTRTAAGAAATVAFSVTPGTATTADYTPPATGTVVFEAGAITADVVIPITDDALSEPDQSFVVGITSVSGFGEPAASGSTATVTIRDNEAVIVSPARIMETRSGAGFTTVDGAAQGIGKQPAGATYELQVTGRGGVPADASAVFLNVTAVAPDGAGFLTVFPCGTTRPTASSVNYLAGEFVPNTVLAKVGTDGKVCVYTLAATDIAVDLQGYVPAGGTPSSVVPARLLETRVGTDFTTVDGVAQGGGRRSAGSTLELQVGGRGNVPADAEAVMLNITVVSPDANGYVLAFPCGTSPTPNATSVNYLAGDITSNHVLAKVGTDGKVCVFTLAGADIAIDVTGYVPAAKSPLGAVPARLLDTRAGFTTVDGASQGGGAVAAGTAVEVVVTNRGGVPADATSVVLNVQAVRPTDAGFLTVYPCGTTRPTASNVNYLADEIVSNGVTAKVGTDGKVCIYTLAATDVVVDVVGYTRGEVNPPVPG